MITTRSKPFTKEEIEKLAFFGSDIKKHPGNYSQKYNSVEKKQSICHNLPFFANNREIQLLKTDPVTPNVITGQLILSTENAGINTDASTTTAKLPNKVESALNSDWEKFTNLVWNKNNGFVKPVIIRIHSQYCNSDKLA